MLHPPEGRIARERLNPYGYMGCGKTEGWVSIAKKYRETNTPGTFYVISTNYQAADRAGERYGPEFYSNIADGAVTEVQNWEELVEASIKATAQMGVMDWIVFDDVATSWTWCQNNYCQKRWGKDFKEYFAALNNTKDSEINWSVVNGEYDGWYFPNIDKSPGHVYACAPGDALRSPSQSGKDPESREVRAMYGRVGVKQLGQKMTGYRIHSTLYMTERRGEYRLTTIDDHGRPDLQEYPIGNREIEGMDFCSMYLQAIAGWVED